MDELERNCLIPCDCATKLTPFSHTEVAWSVFIGNGLFDHDRLTPK